MRRYLEQKEREGGREGAGEGRKKEGGRGREREEEGGNEEAVYVCALTIYIRMCTILLGLQNDR